MQTFYSCNWFSSLGSQKERYRLVRNHAVTLFAFGIDVSAPDLNHTRKVESTWRPAHVANVMSTL